MEPMVVIAARAAEKVGKEILYAHQNRNLILSQRALMG